MTGTSRRLRRVAAALGLAAAVALTATGTVVATAQAASAHSVLVSSSPASGATVASAPADVTLTFDENVRAPAFVVVRGPDGTRADQGSPQILDATVTQPLRPALPAGDYTVDFRVVSADGHPVEEQLSYTVAGAAAGAAAAPAASSPAERGGDDGHLAHVVGGIAVVVLGAGALAFEWLQRRRGSRVPARR